MKRRHLLAGLVAGPVASCAAFAAATSTAANRVASAPLSGIATDASAASLDREQSQAFRDWFTLLIHTQIERGPTPRWTHRDCAGLVRFAVAETLREHDLDWKRANGMLGTRVPPDIAKTQAQALRNTWRRVDGSRDAYVGALELVQENTRFTGKQLTQAQPGDLLFFDLGDEQHLMVWMGRYLAYHTGRSTPQDNGLRALRASQLLEWKDTRWRPAADNPNFSGVYRLSFLAR